MTKRPLDVSSYPTIKSLILGGGKNGAPKITSLSFDVATKILNKIDFSTVVSASIDGQRPDEQAVLNWAKKSLSWEPFPDENPNIVALLLDEISKVKVTAQVTNFAERRKPQKIEIQTVRPVCFAEALFQEEISGVGGVRLMLRFPNHSGGSGLGVVHQEKSDPIESLKNEELPGNLGNDPLLVLKASMEKAYSLSDNEADRIMAEANALEISRNISFVVGVEKISHQLVPINCSVAFPHAEGIKPIEDKKPMKDAPIQEGVTESRETFSNSQEFVTSDIYGGISMKISPDVPSQESSAIFYVTAKIDNLFPSVVLDEITINRQQEPITGDQIMGFFKRWLGTKTVNQIKMEHFGNKVSMLKQIGLYRYLEASRQEHRALYEELDLKPGEILLAYTKATVLPEETTTA